MEPEPGYSVALFDQSGKMVKVLTVSQERLDHLRARGSLSQGELTYRYVGLQDGRAACVEVEE